MRQYIYTITLASSLLASTSCQSWLDVKPEGTPNESNFWKVDSDYERAITATYGIFSKEEIWGRNLFWEQGASDDIFFSRSRGNSEMNIANLDMNGEAEGSLFDIYEEIYISMATANNIIDHALKMDQRTPVIDRVLGEAYFMRAFTHFMVAYRYGRIDNGVPFDRYEDYDPYMPKVLEQRASVIDNYSLIIEDLQKAAEILPWFNQYSPEDYGRATKDAAYAFMVKTYAYWAQHDISKWNDIPALVDKVENEGGRALIEKFDDVFDVDNEWGSEYIWSVNSSGPNLSGSIFPGIMLDNKGWGRYNGWGNFKPTLELWAEFDENDERRAATIMQYGDKFIFFGEEREFYSSADLECGFHFRKYMDPFEDGTVDPNSGAGISSAVSSNGNRPTTDLNVPILRFAELLLFKAEALVETGKEAEAASVLNRLTSRAGMGNKYTTATIEDLMRERRLELAGEFTDRTMDLKRWAVKYNDARARLEAPKHGLKYLNRSDPASALDLENGQTKTIYGKKFEGVIQIMQGKTYDEKDCVLPYEQNEVIKSQGLLKQNTGY